MVMTAAGAASTITGIAGTSSRSCCRYILLLLASILFWSENAVVAAFLPQGVVQTHQHQQQTTNTQLFGLRKKTSGIIIVHPTPPHTAEEHEQHEQQLNQNDDKVARKTIKFLEEFNKDGLNANANAITNTNTNANTNTNTNSNTNALTHNNDDTKTISAPLFEFGDFGSVREAVVDPTSNPSWRSNDPKETLSDWVVKIKRKPNGKTDTYHVHKYVLAVGERRSLYFAKILRETHSTTTITTSTANDGMMTPKSISTVELTDEAADVFPIFLDYVYNVTDHKPDITTQNAVPLHYLARHFAAESLFHELNRFISQDIISHKTAPVFAAMATTFDGEESILDAAIDVCSENFAKLDDCTFAKVLPIVFQEIALKSDCDSLVLSQKIAAYCQRNENRIDRDFLSALTKPTIMNDIDVSSAAWLLKYALIHKLDGRSKTSLANRCKKVIIDNWTSTLVASNFECLEQSTQLELMKTVLPMALEKSAQADELDTEIRKFQRLPNSFATSGYTIHHGKNGAKAFKGAHQCEELYMKKDTGGDDGTTRTTQGGGDGNHHNNNQLMPWLHDK